MYGPLLLSTEYSPSLPCTFWTKKPYWTPDTTRYLISLALIAWTLIFIVLPQFNFSYSTLPEEYFYWLYCVSYFTQSSQGNGPLQISSENWKFYKAFGLIFVQACHVFLADARHPQMHSYLISAHSPVLCFVSYLTIISIAEISVWNHRAKCSSPIPNLKRVVCTNGFTLLSLIHTFNFRDLEGIFVENRCEECINLV